MSGLSVQRDKSQLIFLQRAISVAQYEGIAVFPAGQTTRYLGYAVGTGDLENQNWALRIQQIQRRLVTATRVATSVANRVLLLNSIVLPSILFTAIVFELPLWVEKELTNLYKQLFGHMRRRQTAAVTKSTPGYS